jgi:hypothetical protein
MKLRSLLTVLFVAAAAFVKGQIASSCIVPPALAVAYHKDIVQLATNYLFQVQSPDTALVQVPAQTIDEISGGLAAILNAMPLPESDSVFNLYCVHNNNGWPYEYAGFLVQVDTNYAWTQPWQNMITITGDAYMDSLTARYGLHIANFYNWSIGNYAELTVDSAWNILALMDSLSYMTGVLSVEPNGLLGLAGWIEYQKSGTDRYYDFYFEFNDCFDGCDNYHRWSFRVDVDCFVYYLGFTDWGVFGISPLPAPVNCNTFTSVAPLSENVVRVFPNPATKYISVDVNGYKLETVSVFNSLGEKVKTFRSSPQQTLGFSVEDLPTGIYILEAAEADKTFRAKFIRE